MTPPDPECTVGNRKNTGCDQEAVGRKIGPGFTDKVTVRTLTLPESENCPSFLDIYDRVRAFRGVQGLLCR